MVIEKKSILYFSLYVTYRILLDCIYVNYIYPVFDYTGMHMNGNTYSYVISWIVCVGIYPLFYVNIKKNSFEGLCVYMLGILSFVPTTTLLGLYGVDTKFFILQVVYWVFLFGLIYVLKPLKLPWFPCKQSKYIEGFWLLFSTIVIVYVSGRYTGFRLHFDLIDVYGIRFEERDFNIPILLKYFHNAINTILPVLFILCLFNKRHKLAVFIAFIIFLNFSIGGHKSIIFTLFLAVLAYYFFSWKKKNLLFVGLIGICMISILEPLIFKTGVFYSVFINRLLFIPSQLHIAYYNFFQENELLYFKQGILRWLGFDSPYSLPIEFLIGGQNSGNYEIRANNGLFTDAYMNLGDISVLVFPFILVFIIKLLGAAARGLDARLMFLPVYVTVSALLSTTFSTALLNNGLVLLMFFLLSLPKKSGV